MIKPRCPTCQRIFTGSACPCRAGATYRPLECECGQPAKEVYLDKLGEWPLCARCLELEMDGFAPLPLPEASPEDDPYLFDEGIPLSGTASRTSQPPDFPPLGLSEREYEVAQLAYLKNAQVAYMLKIKEGTVKDHFARILKKLGLHSKREIPYRLRSASAPAAPETSPETAPVSGPPPSPEQPATVTLTVTASPGQLDALLEWLKAFKPG